MCPSLRNGKRARESRQGRDCPVRARSARSFTPATCRFPKLAADQPDCTGNRTRRLGRNHTWRVWRACAKTSAVDLRRYRTSPAAKQQNKPAFGDQPNAVGGLSIEKCACAASSSSLSAQFPEAQKRFIVGKRCLEVGKCPLPRLRCALR